MKINIETIFETITQQLDKKEGSKTVADIHKSEYSFITHFQYRSEWFLVQFKTYSINQHVNM